MMASFWTRQRAINLQLEAANAARDKRDWWEAARGFEQVLAARPRLAPIWVQLGNVSKESGDYRRARRAYETALSMRPDLADVHLQLGHLAKVLGNLEEARQHYDRAFELDPQNENVIAEMQQSGSDSAQRSSPASESVILIKENAAMWLGSGPRVAHRFLTLDPAIVALTKDGFEQHLITTLGAAALNTRLDVATSETSPLDRVELLLTAAGSAACMSSMHIDYLGFLKSFVAALGHDAAAAFVAEYLLSRYPTPDEFLAALNVLGDSISKATRVTYECTPVDIGEETGTFRRIVAESSTPLIEESKLKALTDAIRDLAWHVGDVRHAIEASPQVAHDPRVDDLMVMLLDLADQIRGTA